MTSLDFKLPFESNGKRHVLDRNIEQSPSMMFIERNKGIKEIVEASMRQSQSINFDNFKRNDQAKEAYVVNSSKHMSSYLGKTSKSRLQQQPEWTGQSRMSDYQSVNDQL